MRVISRNSALVSRPASERAWPPHRTLLGHKLQLNILGQRLIEQIADIIELFGAPEEIRTPDPQIRSLTL